MIFLRKEEKQKKEFVRLVNESQGIVHKVCRMYCDDDAHREDLFQEIILQLWKSYPTFKGESKFSTWMYRVALNVAIQDFQKEKKRTFLFLESHEFKEPPASPESEYKDERIKALYNAISK